VASGDPFPNSVLLWTRAVPLPSDKPSNPSSTPFLPDQSVPVCVQFEIAETQSALGGKGVVDSGTAFTSADVDWTVKASDLFITSRPDFQ
jgi:alkaline phosphatase D